MHLPQPHTHVSIRKLALIGGVAIGALYVFTLIVYLLQDSRQARSFNADARSQPGWLAVDLAVRSMDTGREEATVRVEITPQGTLAGTVLGSPARDLHLLISNDRGAQEYVFNAGAVINPFEVTLSLVGDAGLYPFDRYDVFMLVLPADPAAQIPMAVELRTSGRSIRVDSTQEPLQRPGIAVKMAITRASTIRLFVFFAMAVMVVLSLVVLAQSLAIAFRGRKVEPTMFGYMTAMLFAFPALRNALPGVPPYGGLIDVMAFFWAEGIAAIALLIGLLAWLFRPYS